MSRAERAGLAAELTRWVMATAFREAASWPAAADGDALQVGLNVSATQLGDHRVVADVRDALAQAGLPPAGWSWR